ncbi:uncharacterized protein [Anoplolepis gracilipes]|uniref:uncharacterized protein n=1 Tax=Anoplolepis gracilipes TaxID=354296 RepID=UPI003B9E5F99
MASERWKDDIAYAMTPFKLLTWPIGVWPLQVYNIYSLIRCILATCCMSIIVILPTMEIQMGCTDAEQNIDSIMLIVCGILGVLKTICFRIYAKNLIINYGSARNDYLTIENAEYRAIMRRHAFIGRILSCFMVCFSYFSVTIYSLIPLLGDEEENQMNITEENVVLEYPMPSRCALEYFNVPESLHKIICFFEFIVLILTCTCNHGNDSLFLNITLHVCGQVKILKASFIDFDVSSLQVYDRFNALIQRNIYLIEIAKELANAISFVLVTQLFLSSILLCIMGFQFILALKMNNVVMMGKSLMVLCTFLTQLTVYSFVGDYLKSQMEEIGLFIYQSVWYNLPAKLTKNLAFIIMRSQSPVKLQAGNFIVVNLATYMSILKTSISYSHYLNTMASERRKNDIAYAMIPYKLITWPIGIWPLQVYNVYSLIRCAIAICFMSLMMILTSGEVYMGCTDAEENVDCLMLMCCGLLGVQKALCFRIYANNLTINYRSALNDYLTIEDMKERTTMRKHAFKGRIFFCSILFLSYFNCTLFALIPFLHNDHNEQMNVTNENVELKYTIPSRCVLEYFHTPTSMHKFICFMEYISLMLTSSNNHGIDALFLNVTLHVCGQVEILKTRFINFDCTGPRVYKRFNALIQRHSYLIMLAKELANAINFVLALQLFLSSILLCIMGFQFILALKMNDAVMLSKSLMILCTFLTQLTVYSFVGDYLTSQMEEIGLSVYQNTWYNFPIKLTRNLIFIIMRTETPVELYAANFVINLSTYMSILKASISYLSLLRVMMET